MLSKINICNIFFLFWCIYTLQGFFLGDGGLIGQMLLLFNLSVSMCYTIKVCMMDKINGYFKGLLLLLFLFTIYGIALIISNDHICLAGVKRENFLYLKDIYISLLPVFPFYYFSKNGYLSGRVFQKWIPILLLCTIMSYYDNERKIIYESISNGKNQDLEDVVNNVGYMFVSLIPMFVLYYKKVILQYIGVIICMIFILLSMKRGAVIVGIVCVFMLLFRNIKNADLHIKIRTFVLTFLAMIASCYAIIYLLSNNAMFHYRLNETIEGNTSNRNTLFNELWNHYLSNTSCVNQLFGEGANATLKVSFNFAHNDWLEIIINKGVFGVIIYLIYWLYFWRSWFLATNKHAKMVLSLIIVSYLLKSFFSMSYGGMNFCTSSILGYALCKMNSDEFVD